MGQCPARSGALRGGLALGMGDVWDPDAVCASRDGRGRTARPASRTSMGRRRVRRAARRVLRAQVTVDVTRLVVAHVFQDGAEIVAHHVPLAHTAFNLAITAACLLKHVQGMDDVQVLVNAFALCRGPVRSA